MVGLKVALAMFLATALGCASQATVRVPVAAPTVTDLSLEGDDSGEMDCDLCRRGQAGENLWCDECAVGFIGGKRVVGAACFSCLSDGPQECQKCTNCPTDHAPDTRQDATQESVAERKSCGGES